MPAPADPPDQYDEAFAAAYAAENEGNAWNALYERPASLALLGDVLVPGGRLVLSTHHPALDHVLSGGDDYFATTLWDDTWTVGGEQVTMRFWRRPLHAITDALSTAGFAIERIAEPQPLEEARERFPDEHRLLSTLPRFLFLAARAT